MSKKEGDIVEDIVRNIQNEKLYDDTWMYIYS